MPRAKRSSKNRSAPDAIALLKADHKQVKGWFAEFEKSRSESKKQKLATNICNALAVHTKIEDEIFYPAFLAATGDKDIHHEAKIEHQSATDLIAKIEESGASDDYFDSRVHVLSEMIKHHVNEEEKRGGMFDKAKKARKLNLQELGAQLLQRKSALMADLAKS